MVNIELIKKSKIHGRGVFATKNFKKGDFIAFVKGKIVKKKSKSKKDALTMETWYGIGKDTWIDPGKNIFSFINHSCNPNSCIVGTKKIIARRSIKTGEEITVDYSFTDDDPLWEMKCLCKSANCRKVIKSIQFLPKNVFDTHVPNIPLYFKSLYFRKDKKI